jgi:hypothetical protein
MGLEIDAKRAVLGIAMVGVSTGCGNVFQYQAEATRVVAKTATAEALAQSRSATQTARPTETLVPATRTPAPPTETPRLRPTLTFAPTQTLEPTRTPAPKPEPTDTPTPRPTATPIFRETQSQSASAPQVVEVTRVVYVQQPAEQPAPQPVPRPERQPAPEPVYVPPTETPTPEPLTDSVGGVDGCALSQDSDGSSISLGLWNDGRFNEIVVVPDTNPGDVSRKDISGSPTSTNMNSLIRDADGGQATVAPGTYKIYLDNTYTGRFAGPTQITVGFCPPPQEQPADEPGPAPAAPPAQAPAPAPAPTPLTLKYSEPQVQVKKASVMNGHYMEDGPEWILYGSRGCEVDIQDVDQWEKWVSANKDYLIRNDPRFQGLSQDAWGKLDTDNSMSFDQHMKQGHEESMIAAFYERASNVAQRCTSLVGPG